MHTIEEIKEAILSLPNQQKTSLATWLAKKDKEIWDKEIEDDFSEGGKGTDLLKKIQSDFEAGRCSKWD